MEIKKYMKRIILIIVACFGVVYFSFFRNKKEEPRYMTEIVSKMDISQTIVASGTVRSNNRVEVGAQVSGKITEISVHLGQFIKKGDVIAKIDSLSQKNNLEDARSKLKSYQAQLKRAKIQENVAESKFSRSSKLYTTQSISQDEYESSKEALAVAKANVTELEELISQAKISVRTAETNLSYTTITSPIDGVVISIPVSEGQTVNSAQTAPTIVQVADLSKMLIKAEVSEGDITKIREGMAVKITSLANPERVYHSKIQSVDLASSTLTDNEYSESVSNNNAIYYYANIILDNSENNLRIGMTTTNIIEVQSVKNVLAIPTTAISTQKEKFFVKVMEGEKVVEKEVKTGIRNDVYTEIQEGLQEGEEIVVTQLSGLNQIDTVSTRGPRM